MNYQQILAIPFYFDAINTAFREIQKTCGGVAIKAHLQKIVPKDLQLYTITEGTGGFTNKFYLISPDNKNITLITEGLDEKKKKKEPPVTYLKKFLETAKLFEATGGNPLGIYMRYKTNDKIQINGESMKNGIYQDNNIDYLFYQTLCLMKLHR